MTDGADLAYATRVFGEHRDLLVGVAYRVLGSVTDAEDAVQEAWLRWSKVDPAEVANPRAYLVRVTTRLAIDRLRRAKARRESYVGPWLPEPVLTGHDVAEEVELAESVSMAMLVVLETLSPLERAVFVLREAFGMPYAEIGEVIGRKEDAARQLARDHVRERGARRGRRRAGPDGGPRPRRDPGGRRRRTRPRAAASRSRGRTTLPVSWPPSRPGQARTCGPASRR